MAMTRLYVTSAKAMHLIDCFRFLGQGLFPISIIQGESSGRLESVGALRRATRSPGPPQVSTHGPSPRRRAGNPGRPEHPVQVLTWPEPAPTGALVPRTAPPRGETIRRAAQGAASGRGQLPPATRASIRWPPSRDAAGPEDAARESRVYGGGSLLLQELMGVRAPASSGKSRGGPRGIPRCCFRPAPTSTRAAGPQSQGLVRTPLRAPRLGRRGTSTRIFSKCWASPR
ncbi:hypothetical protein NDU88_000396 [Pleurodeles waltl]|uniref:Uncharacterized protein n=1 Tax=Pleurodeles waltl TaxID=8319 RepID=A0AAV7S7E1_PLEWA|nr:hypothetical protein NDU88_000396 [Pleurodeles waltl]